MKPGVNCWKLVSELNLVLLLRNIPNSCTNRMRNLHLHKTTYLCGWVFCKLWIQWRWKWVWSGYLGRGSICSWEFYSEFDVWIYGIEMCLKFVDLIFSWWHCGHHLRTWMTTWLVLEMREWLRIQSIPSRYLQWRGGRWTHGCTL